jgi:hypothetical protein
VYYKSSQKALWFSKIKTRGAVLLAVSAESSNDCHQLYKITSPEYQAYFLGVKAAGA